MQLAEKLRALGQRALRKSRNVAASLSEIGSLFRSEKVRVRRRDHATSGRCQQLTPPENVVLGDHFHNSEQHVIFVF